MSRIPCKSERPPYSGVAYAPYGLQEYRGGINTHRPPPGWTPASIASNVDYFIREDLTRLWTTSAMSTNVTAVADPVGAWRGQRDAITLTQPSAATRPEYAADGILLSALVASKDIYSAYARANNAPFSFFIRTTCTSTNTIYAGSRTATHTNICNGFISTIGGGNVRATSALAVYTDTGTPQTSDWCCVISYDGTNTRLLNDAGVWSNITATSGTPSGTPVNYGVRGDVARLSVDTVDCHGLFTGAVTETEARYLQWWARNR